MSWARALVCRMTLTKMTSWESWTRWRMSSQWRPRILQQAASLPISRCGTIAPCQHPTLLPCLGRCEQGNGQQSPMWLRCSYAGCSSAGDRLARGTTSSSSRSTATGSGSWDSGRVWAPSCTAADLAVGESNTRPGPTAGSHNLYRRVCTGFRKQPWRSQAGRNLRAWQELKYKCVSVYGHLVASQFNQSCSHLGIHVLHNEVQYWSCLHLSQVLKWKDCQTE